MSEKMSFQEQVLQLEEIVEKLEAGDVTLEESFKLYKQGMKTLGDCHAHIDTIEKEMEVINKESKA